LLRQKPIYQSGTTASFLRKIRYFIFGDPQAQQLLVALEVDAERNVDRFVDDLLVLAHLDDDTVQIDDRIERIQRSALPLGHLIDDRVGDLRDQRRGHLGAVHLLEGLDDLARRHPLRVEAQDLVVEGRQAGLVLAQQLGLEGAVAVPGRVDLDLAVLALELLRGLAVAAIAGVAALRGVFLVAQMVFHFGAESGFDGHFGQLVGQLAEIPLGLDLLGQLGNQLLQPFLIHYCVH
jgi:hypothetical protein